MNIAPRPFAMHLLPHTVAPLVIHLALVAFILGCCVRYPAAPPALRMFAITAAVGLGAGTWPVLTGVVDPGVVLVLLLFAPFTRVFYEGLLGAFALVALTAMSRGWLRELLRGLLSAVAGLGVGAIAALLSYVGILTLLASSPGPFVPLATALVSLMLVMVLIHRTFAATDTSHAQSSSGQAGSHMPLTALAGVPLHTQAPTTPTLAFCPSCGSANYPGAVYCIGCGEQLPAGT
ncbi:MAG TPA: hypothetical protein VEI97_10745 [bacterium]|nr:hypothetical protein [bacterium]